MNSLSQLTAGCVLGLALFSNARAQETATDFEKAVAPILVKNCLNCHNSSEPKGNLDLTGQETVAKGGKTRTTLVPGKANESFLIRRVTEGSMPPKKGGRRLTEDEIASLSRWIDSGAKWPAGRVLSPFEFTTEHRSGLDWWAFQPVSRPQIPAVKSREWVRNPVDAFILAKLEDNKVAPAPPADKTTYLRRAKYDLLGLPPTPQEIDAFLADDSPDAYETADNVVAIWPGMRCDATVDARWTAGHWFPCRWAVGRSAVRWQERRKSRKHTMRRSLQFRGVSVNCAPTWTNFAISCPRTPWPR